MNRIGDSLHCTGENEEIIRAFKTRGVDFVLISGLAISWYCANRQADDMDLIVNPTPDNSKLICEALSGLGLHGFETHSFTKPGLQAPLKKLHYAEILTPRTNGPTYSELIKDAVEAKLFNIPIRLASIQSLIQLKQLAVASADIQREKHIKDIDLLKSRFHITLSSKGTAE